MVGFFLHLGFVVVFFFVRGLCISRVEKNGLDRWKGKKIRRIYLDLSNSFYC